jgi:hypothetical protein
MVLRLKTRKSRSLPGLRKTEVKPFIMKSYKKPADQKWQRVLWFLDASLRVLIGFGQPYFAPISLDSGSDNPANFG